MAVDVENKPDFSNPLDPETKKFLNELQTAIANEIIALVSFHRDLEEKTSKQRMQTEIFEQERLQQKEKEDAHFQAQIAANNKIIENEVKLASEPVAVNDLRTQINADLSKLEIQKYTLEAKIQELTSKITVATKDASEGLETRRKEVTSAIVAAIKEPNNTIVVRDPDGTERSATSKEKEAMAERVREAPPPVSFDDKMKNSEYRVNLLCLMLQDRNGETINQIAKKEHLVNQIQAFANMGGGEDMTPLQMLTFVRKNKVVNNMFSKLSNKNLELDTADLKKLSDLYKDLKKTEDSLSSTTEKIAVMKQQLQKIDEILDKVDKKQEEKQKGQAKFTPTKQ